MDYDVGKAFAAIEEELIDSMMRNMKRHRAWEDDEGFQWSMWQAEQLKALDQYKRTNKKKFERQFNEINGSIRTLIERAREQGNMDQELEILEAIEKGWKPPKRISKYMDTSAEFFKLNTRKLEALIKATENDFKRAEVAMLRMADDQYRKVIFNAQVYANTGAGTYEQAVDMATKDFMSRGINCIEYANGARHTMKDYAEMAIRTAAKRAYLAGEGEKRQEWGIHTVIVHKRGNPCPLCLPFVGKVLIDDVWSGGSSAEGQKYPLMSTAVAAGLYHPNCKDAHSTYFPGISEAPDEVFTNDEIEEVKREYTLDQKRQVAKRNYERYSRLEEHALDEEDKRLYGLRKEQWLNKYKDYYKQYRNASRDKEQFERYRKTLGKLAPRNIEDFVNIKYNNKYEYGKLKHAYRIVNQYENNNGNMSPAKIVELHDEAVSCKAKFTGKARKNANIGIMEMDGEIYVANSNIDTVEDPRFDNYKGDKSKLIVKPEKGQFETFEVGTHNRDVDSEYKLFEHAAIIASDGKPHKITLLSEKAMCESCQSVMKQFMERYPNVEVTVVSHKKKKAEKNHNKNPIFEFDAKRKFENENQK